MLFGGLCKVFCYFGFWQVQLTLCKGKTGTWAASRSAKLAGVGVCERGHAPFSLVLSRQPGSAVYTVFVLNNWGLLTSGCAELGGTRCHDLHRETQGAGKWLPEHCLWITEKLVSLVIRFAEVFRTVSIISR